MSIVTGIMLLTAVSDDETAEPMLDWLRSQRPRDSIYDISDNAGGGKHPQYCAFASGMNMVDPAVENELVDRFLAADWMMPENAILILQPEEGETLLFRPKPYDGGNSQRSFE